jgi:hypothetical protein
MIPHNGKFYVVWCNTPTEYKEPNVTNKKEVLASTRIANSILVLCGRRFCWIAILPQSMA